MKKVVVIHGPNLNFTGIREQGVYGSLSFEQINENIKVLAAGMGIDVKIFQSNSEGAIVDELQVCFTNHVDAIIINPGAFAHYSYAIHDAIKSVSIPTIEVHMSNIYAREEFRHTSVTAPACIGQISGFGPDSYYLAMEALKSI